MPAYYESIIPTTIIILSFYLIYSLVQYKFGKNKLEYEENFVKYILSSNLAIISSSLFSTVLILEIIHFKKKLVLEWS